MSRVEVRCDSCEELFDLDSGDGESVKQFGECIECADPENRWVPSWADRSDP